MYIKEHRLKGTRNTANPKSQSYENPEEAIELDSFVKKYYPKNETYQKSLTQKIFTNEPSSSDSNSALDARLSIYENLISLPLKFQNRNYMKGYLVWCPKNTSGIVENDHSQNLILSQVEKTLGSQISKYGSTGFKEAFLFDYLGYIKTFDPKNDSNPNLIKPGVASIDFNPNANAADPKKGDRSSNEILNLKKYNTNEALFPLNIQKGVRFFAEETLFLVEKGALRISKCFKIPETEDENHQLLNKKDSESEYETKQTLWLMLLSLKSIDIMSFQAYSQLHRLGFITVGHNMQLTNNVSNLRPQILVNTQKSENIFLRAPSCLINYAINTFRNLFNYKLYSLRKNAPVPLPPTERSEIELTSSHFYNTQIYDLYKPSRKDFSKRKLQLITPDWTLISLKGSTISSFPQNFQSLYSFIKLAVSEKGIKTRNKKKQPICTKSAIMSFAELGTVSFLKFDLIESTPAEIVYKV
ncbi:hypothetical protein BB560_000474 [Smittium megazygosporum]|uniref:Uncharacterized protein n=1 Tax=Smittium megazygosporum TaxID=133381 RepID=A0A2T9ZKD4_9FUNG|nr:hypothetical protein BB560_000474 [Smittium megazygosporum]